MGCIMCVTAFDNFYHSLLAQQEGDAVPYRILCLGIRWKRMESRIHEIRIPLLGMWYLDGFDSGEVMNNFKFLRFWLRIGRSTNSSLTPLNVSLCPEICQGRRPFLCSDTLFLFYTLLCTFFLLISLSLHIAPGIPETPSNPTVTSNTEIIPSHKRQKWESPPLPHS